MKPFVPSSWQRMNACNASRSCWWETLTRQLSWRKSPLHGSMQDGDGSGVRPPHTPAGPSSTSCAAITGRKLRDAKPPPSWAAADADQPAADVGIEDSLQILDALRALPPARRATVILRFYEDLSDHEIARVLDRPLGTVKSDIHRAVNQLRSLMDITSAEGRS